MRRLQLAAIIGVSLLGMYLIPSVLASTVFHEFLNERECFEVKAFVDRQKAEQEIERWENALGDKMAGLNFNGLTNSSITSTPLTICVFTNK